MINQVTIENFRGFAALTISKLRRVNIIVGQNSAGKTALLEALFMSSGAAAPNATFAFKALRQLGNQIRPGSEPSAYQGLWEDLFHWFNQDKTIVIEIIGSNGDSRSLRVFYSDAPSQILPIGRQAVNPNLVPQIVFEWKKADEPPIVVRPKLTATGLVLEGAVVDHSPVIMFSPHSPDAPEANARRFSELSKVGKVEPVIEALRIEFPFLDSLSIEYSGAIPTVFASFKHQQLKMPVALISDGINKLLSILLGIASFPRGLILIDQLEDGFYFDRMPSIWKILYRFATINDAQIFATTHNRELLSSMIETIRGHEDDFTLLHAQRENGSCSIRSTEGRFFGASLEQNFEIR
jgi:AAA15 family ATPase/GTPase